MKPFKVPEEFRVHDHPLLGSDQSYGNNGAFVIAFSSRSTAFVMASDGEGWEHVSVHMITKGKPRTPTWAEMCRVKDMFWSGDACVVQYHPPESDYVNNHKHTLHLWRPVGMEIPRPESILV